MLVCAGGDTEGCVSTNTLWWWWRDDQLFAHSYHNTHSLTITSVRVHSDAALDNAVIPSQSPVRAKSTAAAATTRCPSTTHITPFLRQSCPAAGSCIQRQPGRGRTASRGVAG